MNRISRGTPAGDAYVDAEVEPPWVASLLERLPELPGPALAREEFWLAIDVYGTGEPYLVTRKKARLVNLARRAPERHTGSNGSHRRAGSATRGGRRLQIAKRRLGRRPAGAPESDGHASDGHSHPHAQGTHDEDGWSGRCLLGRRLAGLNWAAGCCAIAGGDT